MEWLRLREYPGYLSVEEDGPSIAIDERRESVYIQNIEEARALRDWLTAWIEEQEA